MGNAGSHSMFAEDNIEEDNNWGFPLNLLLKARKLSTTMTLDEKAMYHQQGKKYRVAYFPFAHLPVRLCNLSSEFGMHIG